MHVLIAPDCFGTTLTALEAGVAIRDGWRETAPREDLEFTLLPMADGGPGFLDVLARHVGGERRTLEVTDPWGTPRTATVLVVDQTAYVESADAVGLHLAEGRALDPVNASSIGLGQLLDAIRDWGLGRVMVGLGGSAVMDGGAGAAQALVEWPSDIELVACTDVLVPLLGPTGAVYGFGPQKGAAAGELAAFEQRMARQGDVLSRLAGREVGDLAGAGAAGGLGAWLLALGARVVSGVDVVADAAGLDAAIATASLVVTGEGKTDAGSLQGKVVGGVARRAARAGKPCVVIAGQIEVGRREAAAHGIDELVSCSELAGSPQASMAEPGRWLQAAAAQIAPSWSAGRR